jgi:hypothetical protein
MSLRPLIMNCAAELAEARQAFERDIISGREPDRDKLLATVAYGVQNCLRSLAMQFPASAMEAATAGETGTGSTRSAAARASSEASPGKDNHA